MLLNCCVEEDSWESLGLQGDPTTPSLRRSVLGVHWKDWCWNLNFKTLATWCEELTHLKKPWCCERLRAGGEGDDRGWDGWMASLTQWTCVWVNCGSWWWTGRPGVLWFMGSQSRHYWVTELNWSSKLQVFVLLACLFFPECHVVGIIQYVLFSDWLLSLSNMFLRFPHVFFWLDSLFLFREK